MSWQAAAEECSLRLSLFCQSAKAAASASDPPDDGIVDELRQLISAHANLQQQLSTAPANDDTDDARTSSHTVSNTLQRFMLGLDDAATKLRDALDTCYDTIPEADYTFQPKDVIRLAHRIRNNASMMIRPPNADGVVEPPLPPAPQKWDMQASQLQQFNLREQQRQQRIKQQQQQEQQQEKQHDQQAAADINLAAVLAEVFRLGFSSRSFQQLGMIMDELKTSGWSMAEFAKGNVPVKLAAFLRDYHERKQAAVAAEAAAAAAAQASPVVQQEQQEVVMQEDTFARVVQASNLPAWMLDDDDDDDDDDDE